MLQIFYCRMQEAQNDSKYRRLQSHSFQLTYQPNDAEGECIIHSILPVRFIGWRFVLYILLNAFLLIPLLLTYWNDKYKKIFYMQSCPLAAATHFYIINYDGQASIVKRGHKNFWTSETESRSLDYFVNRYMTYIIDEEGVARLSVYDYGKRLKEISNMKIQEKGLSTEHALKLKQTFGPGTMVIKKPGLIELIIFEVIKPLYIFLLFSVLFWYIAEGYLYFATTLLVVFLIGVVINLYQMVQLNNKIFAMAYYEIGVNVLRNGSVSRISSFEVVPGDIVFLKDPIKIPFQGVILEGSALINQCALTGESVPVVKKADRFDKIVQNPSVDKNAFVFEGTTIIQVSDQKKMSKFQTYREQFGIPVCVVKTNFTTTKGQLIRIILFPIEQENIFQRQSTKFLFFLFVIAVASYTAIIVINIDYEETTDIIIKLIDIILIAVPPALPVSMTFGIIYALERLNEKKIFCISQNKVIVGGIIEFCCFDKTGTLTQDYMDFYCVVPSYAGKFHTQVANTEEMSQYIIDNVKVKPYYLPALNNMATNHSIVKIQATGQLIGDPMEIKAFQFGKFKLNQAISDQDSIFSFESDRGHNGIVYRRYEFQSQLQRMSVVAKSSLTEGYHVYAKGSPEMMLTIMKKNSIPKNYNEILKEYASHGFRVLAIASKPVSDQNIKTWGRDQMQDNLTFNGFEIFQNPLKKETANAIKELKQAEIDCVMITGDNTLTGSNISYKCSISDRQKNMIIVDCPNGKLTEQHFVFHDYDNTKAFPADKPIAESYIEEDIRVSLLSKQKSSSRMRSSYRERSELNSGFEPRQDNSEEFMFNLKEKAEQMNCQLCVTGRAFNQLFSGSLDHLTNIQRDFMSIATVFARTKPNDKARIVMVFQKLGKKVSMCGDGANDCGALKQADIGLSLSQAEASISAPFTSQVTNISSMVELIKECRAGLATNFSLFNIMAIYSLIQFTSSLVCEYFLQYPADFQYLYWDICMNFLLILFIGYTGTADKLSIQKPRNSLFSVTNLVQIMIMFVIQFGGQVFAIWLFSYINPVFYNDNGGQEISRQNYIDSGAFALNGVEGNTVFVFVNNIYLASVLAFNISRPWRKEVFTNLPLVIVTALALTYNTIIAVVPGGRLGIFSLDNLSEDPNVALFIYIAGLGFSLFLYVNQKFILQPISDCLIRKYPKATWL